MFATGNDVAHISALDGMVTVVDHEAVGIVHVTLVVAYRRGGLVVHDHLHPFLGGIAVNLLHVEVGIGSYEIEYIVLAVSEPVFPTDVPAFDQHGIETVGRRKVDVALHVLGVGRVGAIGLGLGVVGLVQMHAIQVVGIGPGAFAGNHIPPDTDVFRRFYPGGIGKFARLVQVEGDARGEDVAGIVAHDNRTPGRTAGGLHVALVAFGIGGEPRLEHHILVVEVQVHARVVDQSGFVQVDVEAVVGLHHQGRLHAGGREGSLRRVGRNGLLHQPPNLGEARSGVVVLLGIVVARNPEGGMVAGHGKLRVFLLDNEIVELFLLRELVAEAQTIVEQPEANDNLPLVLGLVEGHGQLVVVVAYLALFAPNRTPGLVETRCLRLGHRKSVHQVGLGFQPFDFFRAGELKVGLCVGVLLLEFQTQGAGLDDRFSFII